MKRKYLGLVLILMMLGHNYVINQPQSLQKQIEKIHSVNVTQFNLLYSIPSILAILTIIPVGILYHKYPNFTLMFGVIVLFIGQLLASMFGSEGKEHYFLIFVGGRTFQASGAEILYMIQGNLASSWMGNFAGLVFILPEIGEIMNAFLTPYAALTWGVQTSLWIGLIFCFISVIACFLLLSELKKRQKIRSLTKISMSDQISPGKTISIKQETKPQTDTQNQHRKLKDEQSFRQSPSIGQNVKSVKDLKNNEHESKERSSDEELNSEKIPKSTEPETILKAGRIFWLTILICAVNECLYFPFLDNANQLIQTRFKIPYSQTGYFLCLPFFAAILTTMIMSKFLECIQRKNLIFYSSVLPFKGHLMILMLPNCTEESLNLGGKLLLACGFFIFGTGIGAYYSICFPAVGMAVPQKIRGLSYGVLCFFQTIAMSMIPIVSGLIIQQDITNEIEGYRNSSMMFVGLTLFGVIVAFTIKKMATQQSFRYDDKQDMTEEEDMSLEMSNDKIQMKKMRLDTEVESKNFISIDQNTKQFGVK